MPWVGAAPGPLFGVGDESCFYGVVVNVGDDVGEVLFVADIPPDVGHGLAGFANELSDGVGGVGFPGSHDRIHAPAVDGLEEDMNVVGHDGPCDDPVAFSVEVEKGVLNNTSAVGSP